MDTVRVEYENPNYREEPKKIEFIRGNFYRTRDGRKAECVHIWPDDGVHFVCDGPPMDSWSAHADGKYIHGREREWDIVGPWREPVQVRVGLYRHQATGQVRVWDEIGMSGMYAADTWELVETWTLTEGTGNAST